jgi:hypothetical protein
VDYKNLLLYIGKVLVDLPCRGVELTWPAGLNMSQLPLQQPIEHDSLVGYNISKEPPFCSFTRSHK